MRAIHDLVEFDVFIVYVHDNAFAPAQKGDFAT
jgi:hypothetical protein